MIFTVVRRALCPLRRQTALWDASAFAEYLTNKERKKRKEKDKENAKSEKHDRCCAHGTRYVQGGWRLCVLGLLHCRVVLQRSPVQALGVDERPGVLLLRKLQVL
jgi:hypothetical protein